MSAASGRELCWGAAAVRWPKSDGGRLGLRSTAADAGRGPDGCGPSWRCHGQARRRHARLRCTTAGRDRLQGAVAALERKFRWGATAVLLPESGDGCWVRPQQVRSQPARPKPGESAAGPGVASRQPAASSPAGAATSGRDPVALECGAMAPSDAVPTHTQRYTRNIIPVCRGVSTGSVELQRLVFPYCFVEICILEYPLRYISHLIRER